MYETNYPANKPRSYNILKRCERVTNCFQYGHNHSLCGYGNTFVQRFLLTDYRKC